MKLVYECGAPHPVKPMCAYHASPRPLNQEDALIEYLAQLAVHRVATMCRGVHAYNRPYRFTEGEPLSSETYALLASLFGDPAKRQDPLVLRSDVRDKIAALVESFLSQHAWNTRVYVREVDGGEARDALVLSPIRGPAHYFYVSATAKRDGWQEAQALFWVTLDSANPVGAKCVP
jgi:hypothetical protein